MAKFALVLGVALSAAAAAHLYTQLSTRNYVLALSADAQGTITATKVDGGPYRVHPRGQSVWHFRNDSTRNLQVRFRETAACHFRFTPPAAAGCASTPVGLPAGGGQPTITVHVADQNDTGCGANAPCPTDIDAVVADGTNWTKVDPDLQIDRDYLKLDLLILGAGLASAAYALYQLKKDQDYIRSRKSV